MKPYYYLAVNAERKQHYETAKAYTAWWMAACIQSHGTISLLSLPSRINCMMRFALSDSGTGQYPQHASFLYLAQADILKRMNNKNAAIRILEEAKKPAG